MHTEPDEIPIQELANIFHTIEYPEFQREPTVWGLKNKRLLIDSILRRFDIGSVYLISDDLQALQCIDGRQRLNALFSFLGLTPDSKHNKFTFRSSNEVREDNSFDDINNCSYFDNEFERYREGLLNYRVKIVRLFDVDSMDQKSDLNLQFQRLQIAQVLNGAEKLNAMVGEMRDFVFAEGGFGSHEFFSKLGVRAGRFGNQQTASQICINADALVRSGSFSRARFADMQLFFKKWYSFDEQMRTTAGHLQRAANDLDDLISEECLAKVKNRAMAVSLFLFYFNEKYSSAHTDLDWGRYPEFVIHVLKELETVRGKGISIDKGPQNVWERLQIDITQASVERVAIERRNAILNEEFRSFCQ